VFILYEAQINLTQNCQVGTKVNLSPLFKCILRVDVCYISLKFNRPYTRTK